MNIALRIARCELRLEKLRNIANFADLTPGKFPQDMIKKYVTAIESAIDGLDADLTAPTSTYSISGVAARHQSIVTAFAKWAR